MNGIKNTNIAIIIPLIFFAISVLTIPSSGIMTVYAQQIATTNNTYSTAQMTDNATAADPSSRELVVIARDLEEISDNLEEARIALNNNDYIQVLQHLDNIEDRIRVLLTPGLEPGVSMLAPPSGIQELHERG